MDRNTPLDLQRLIDRFDVDPIQARAEILERAAERLRRLATKMMCESFPAVRTQHELDSVVNESWLRLRQALGSTQPTTVKDFFRLAAHKIRQVLLDMVTSDRKMRDHKPAWKNGGDDQQTADQSDSTYNPERLFAWTTFHEQVSRLPNEERHVFEMHYYLEISQAEIAVTLELPPRQISRLWVSAIDQLRKDCNPLLEFL